MCKIKSYKFIVFMGVLISIFIGTRAIDVGSDTESYIRHFNNSSLNSGIYDRFEIGFSLLMQLFSKSVANVEVFFTFLAMVITLTYIKIFKITYSNCFLDRNPSTKVFMVFLSLLLFSSWYVTATTNGLRQGLSLVFVYWALTELFYSFKKLNFFILSSIAMSFHFSAILVLPLFFIHYIRFKYVFFIWALIGGGYVLGLNEMIVKLVSEALALPVYDYVKYYTLDDDSKHLGGGLYNGFDVFFFLYTVFWPMLFLFNLKVNFRTKYRGYDLEKLYALAKIYFGLSSIYFIFGFGPFSNRYALFSWFFVPIIQISIIRLHQNLISSRSLVIVTLLSSLIFFLYFRLDWIRYIAP